jgi:octaprenyl-diphosphate synthase
MVIFDKISQAKQLPVDLVKKELQLVESRILEQVRAFDRSVEPYIDYICNTSGKRIRPVLAVIAGGATGGVSEDHIKIGVIIELIHMATLVHDDIIDEASTRRKVPTPNAKWGNGLAVLLGDALFSHALMLATEFDSTLICRKVGKASRDVCEGEIIQTQRRFDLSLNINDYFKIVEMKTGGLFAAATEIAAIISGASEATCKYLYEYGMKLGVAYQIYDDCIDMVGSEESVGKTLRTDLEKGKLTLPMLYLIESATPEQKGKINKRIIEQQPLDLDVLVGIAEYEGAVARALNTASEMVKSCRADLEILPETKYKDGFVQITEFLDSLLAKCRR